MTTRRDALALIAAGAAGAAVPAFAAGPDPVARLRAIEAGVGGRVGVAALDTGSGRRLRYRAGERFPICSTFKVLAAAAILHRVDTSCEQLDRRIVFDKADLVTYSPETEKHAGEGMTLAALCEAAITLSDNTAGNMLIKALGGPQGVTGYVRSIGDAVSRLDRWEPELNQVGPGERRDTTTPAAMEATLRKLLLGHSLAPASRKRLLDWMLDCRTGDARLRAGLPKDWRVADKTGTGPAGGGANDVAVVWPPSRAPILAAVYTDGSTKDGAARSAAIAAVGRVIAETL